MQHPCDTMQHPCDTMQHQVHTSSRCKCVLGSNALFGLDGGQGAAPHSGVTSCLADGGAWRSLGALFDPQVSEWEFLGEVWETKG
jgi:hypothetical protein